MKKDEVKKTTQKTTKNSEITEIQEKTTTSTEVTVIDKKNNKVSKAKKVSKKHLANVPRKKLPKIYKKRYSKSQFKKKLLSKLYIADDKKYVESLFEEIKIGKKEKLFYKIPEDKLFSPVETKRLKVLAKQIKKQKGTVKFLPLILIIAIVASVFIFTDLILKIGLNATFQNIFKAKSSIGYIHLDYGKSSLEIKNLVVANKDAPMTNLFQFDSIVFDIDINRLLEKSVVIDEIEAAGFAMGTERKTSGELIIKPKKVKEKKVKEEKPKEPIIKPEFIESAKSKVTGDLQELFAKFDPDTIIKSIYGSLQTPVVSENISKDLATLLPYWQNKPTEISNDVNSFIKKANSLSSLDFSNIKDLTKLQENIDSISSIIKEGEELSNSLKSTYNKLDSDIKNVTKLTSNLEKAIQADTKLASNITSSIKSFTPQNGMRILSNTVENFMNSTLGNFYPTIQDAFTMINEFKSKLPAKEEKTEKVERKIERLDGTNFYWGREEMPQFYVGSAHASGSGFDVLANNLSSEPQLINKPMTLDGTYSIDGRQDSFSASLDLRETTDNPMFSASYHAPSVNTAFEFLNSDSTLDIQLTAEADKSITIYGNANLSNAKFTIPAFTPDFAYNLCEQAGSQINTTYLGITAAFAQNGNLRINVNTDFDNQFMKGVTSLVNKEINNIKDKASLEIASKLEEYSGPIKEKIAEFNQYKTQIDESKKQLENKIAELQNKIEEGKNKLIQQGKDKVENTVSDTLNKYVDTSKLDSLKKYF